MKYNPNLILFLIPNLTPNSNPCTKRSIDHNRRVRDWGLYLDLISCIVGHGIDGISLFKLVKRHL